MPLSPQTRLGPYEIISAIGAGGMGEVYRARDTRLDRIIAIKVLPEDRSSSPDARERFEREAKAISSLTHPHICPLYDVGSQDGIDYLVMEYLEGQTLAELLGNGPLPLEQVLKYAIQITDALDHAHRRAVIHRDLNPSNIMITKAGVKLLDFGLAKVRTPEPAAGATVQQTRTTALTSEGTILGTLQYMAPEQLEGRHADARTDIFALGEVIYEMATAQKVFQGQSQASLISAIMTAEPPPISAHHPLTPPALDHVVRTCLAKDPEARWQSAYDVLIEMNWIADGGSSASASGRAVTHRRGLEWMLAALLAVVSIALVTVAVIHFREKPGARAIRFLLPSPDKLTFSGYDFPVISPDGTRVVFTATSPDGGRLLWRHALDSLAAEPVAGTDGAFLPFWSPDSRFVAFFSGGKLKKIDISGGPAQTLCDIGVPGPVVGNGGTWNQDGVILFGADTLPLQRISADGGIRQPVLELSKSRRETGHFWPHFLPDGKHFLYMAESADASQSGIFAGSLDSRESELVIRAYSNVSYATSGYVVYGNQQTVLAQKFDAKSRRVSGVPFPIAEQVGRFAYIPGSLFSISQNGALVYGGLSSMVQLAWHSREGKRLASIGKPGVYPQIALSPDDKLLAVERIDPQAETRNLWILELESNIFSRLTFNPSGDYNPVWSPDAKDVLFSSRREGHQDLHRKAVGGGEEEVVYQSTQDKGPYHMSKDGWILFFAGGDFYRLPLVGERKPVLALKSEFIKDLAAVSRDDKWVAYESPESGRMEVYVASYPTFTGRRQISNGGGSQPLWRNDGKELFYLTVDSKIVGVDVKAGNTLEAGTPQVLFQAPIRVNQSQTEYSVTGDGKRFIFREPVAENSMPMTVVLNWTTALKR